MNAENMLNNRNKKVMKDGTLEGVTSPNLKPQVDSKSKVGYKPPVPPKSSRVIQIHQKLVQAELQKALKSKVVNENVFKIPLVIVKDDCVETEPGPESANCPNSNLNSDVKLNNEKLLDRNIKSYLIAKDLVESERVFSEHLKVLNIDFRQKISGIVSNELVEKILLYIPMVVRLNEELLDDLHERVNNWEVNPKIADILVKFIPFFKLYSSYVKEFDKITKILEETCAKYSEFNEALIKFEQEHKYKGIVKHLMLKIVQRITNYPLFLERYLKSLNENCCDYEDTNKALIMVKQITKDANDDKKNQNFQKLLEIQGTLVDNVDLIQAGRSLIKEGYLIKLSRKEQQKRYFVLCSDILIYLKPVQSGIKIRNILPLAGMRVEITNLEGEFDIISNRRSFRVYSKDRDEWINAIQSAVINDYERRKSFSREWNDFFDYQIDHNYNYSDDQINDSSQENISKDAYDSHSSTIFSRSLESPYNSLRSASPDSTNSLLDLNKNKPLDLGISAPVWIPDDRVTMCKLCNAEFTIAYRRHHCRACGNIVCGDCSKNKAPLKYMNYEAQRVCDICYNLLMEPSSSTNNNNDGTISKPRSSGRRAKSLPKVLKEVSGNDKDCDISGYVKFRYGKKDWKKRWLVIKEKVLYEFAESEDSAAVASFPLLSFQIEKHNNDKNVFSLIHSGSETLYFKFNNDNIATRWMKVINENIHL